jgi:hypothetical protein
MNDSSPSLDLLRRLYNSAEPVESVTWDMPSFLAGYTLHDSAFVEARLTERDGLLILIDWDMHWNRKVRPQYNRLVIGLPVVYSVSWSQGGWRQSTLSDATSQRLTEHERNQMLERGDIDLGAFQGSRDELPPPFDDESLTRTIIEWCNWTRLTILHGGEARLLCLDDAGAAGELPRDVTEHP